MSKRDAVGERKCKHCRFWHDPAGNGRGEHAVCIRRSPTAFPIGVAPTSVLVDPSKPGANMAPIFQGFWPLTGAEQGCGEFEGRLN